MRKIANFFYSIMRKIAKFQENSSLQAHCCKSFRDNLPLPQILQKIFGGHHFYTIENPWVDIE